MLFQDGNSVSLPLFLSPIIKMLTALTDKFQAYILFTFTLKNYNLYPFRNSVLIVCSFILALRYNIKT